MTILPIRLFPDPILRKKSKEIENIDLEILELRYNLFTGIPKSLTLLNSLKYIGLSYNKIENFS